MRLDETFFRDRCGPGAFSRRTFLGTTALAVFEHALRRSAQPEDGRAAVARRRARSIVFLFMSGGPSQHDLFDEKPLLRNLDSKPVPDSVLKGLRLAQTSRQSELRILGSPFRFRPCGRNADARISELLPMISTVANDIAVVRSMYTDPDAVNHEPAAKLLLTGSVQPGRPASGSWLSHSLPGSRTGLPRFAVMLSGEGGQPLTREYWSNGFLPGEHQGVVFDSGGEPVLYLENPPGISRDRRHRQLEALRVLNGHRLARKGDPSIATRTRAYELAFEMQQAVPEAVDLSAEPPAVLDEYGIRPREKSFAANCLLARRLVERDVPFVCLIHREWDHHEGLPSKIVRRCQEVDRPCAALVRDLKRSGLLDQTLVVWVGEFGRTPFAQGTDGRDHQPGCFSMWMSGGGVKKGIVYGATDEFGCRVTDSPVHVHDLNATLLHCMGFDHRTTTYLHQGREFRLTDVGGRVVHELLE